LRQTAPEDCANNRTKARNTECGRSSPGSCSPKDTGIVINLFAHAIEPPYKNAEGQQWQFRPRARSELPVGERRQADRQTDRSAIGTFSRNGPITQGIGGYEQPVPRGTGTQQCHPGREFLGSVGGHRVLVCRADGRLFQDALIGFAGAAGHPIICAGRLRIVVQTQPHLLGGVQDNGFGADVLHLHPLPDDGCPGKCGEMQPDTEAAALERQIQLSRRATAYHRLLRVTRLDCPDGGFFEARREREQRACGWRDRIVDGRGYQLVL